MVKNTKKSYIYFVDDFEYVSDKQIIYGSEIKDRLNYWEPIYSLVWDRHRTRATNKLVADGPDLAVSDSQQIDLGDTPLYFYTLPPHGF